VSPQRRSFQQFSNDLDAEWLRERIRASLATTTDAAEEDALATAIGRADPLADAPRGGADAPRGGWLGGILDALGTWPARLSFAGAAATLVLIGVGVGRVVAPSTPRITTAAIPRPTYEPDQTRPLGAAPAVTPESERKFRDAMALLEAPDFAARALPLLQGAVAEDAANDRAQFWLGVVLLLKGQAADSVGPLEEAARLAPASSRYRQYLMVAYLQTGATDKALALQTQLLERR
jgi:tetratricopeptide (TPR) repeat protein